MVLSETYTFLNTEKCDKLHVFSKGLIPTLNKEKNFYIYLMLDFGMSVAYAIFMYISFVIEA